MKKLLRKASRKLQEKAFDQLKSVVMEDFEENEMYYIEDVLNELKCDLRNYDIGFWQRNIIRLESFTDYPMNSLSGIFCAQKNYCIFTDDEYKEILRIKKGIKSYFYMEYGNKNLEQLGEWLERKKEWLEDVIEEFFDRITNYENKCIEEHYFDFWLSERSDNYYIDTVTEKVFIKQEQYREVA